METDVYIGRIEMPKDCRAPWDKPNDRRSRTGPNPLDSPDHAAEGAPCVAALQQAWLRAEHSMQQEVHEHCQCPQRPG